MDYKDILSIAKREIRLCITEKTTLFGVVILPFCMILGVTLLMSSMIKDEKKFDYDDYIVYSVNAPNEFKDLLSEFKIKSIEDGEIDSCKDKIGNKKADLLIEFSEDFKIANGENDEISNIDIWYNSSNNKSVRIYSIITDCFAGLQPSVFNVNKKTDIKYDLAGSNDEILNIIGSALPMLLVMAIFMTCSSVSAESIAGDKERGFLNTVLLTPVKRSSIALGKAVSVYFLSIVSGISAFIGLGFSVSQISSSVKLQGGFSYSIMEYLMIFLVTIVLVFSMASLLLVISTLSKSVKQATTISPIIMMVIMTCTMLTSLSSFDTFIQKIGMVNDCIPIWNLLLSVKQIMMLDYSPSYLLVSVLIDTLFCLISIIVISKLFKSEKIVNG